MAGAGFCHHCGHQLPAPQAEPPKLIACDSCGRKALPEANYCAECGEPLAGGLPGPTEDGLDTSERLACSDGLCIGIIGADGKCTECGKPSQPTTEEPAA
jgi:DNA-directed RNA polymerase subunit RPC12/RpoP